MSVEIEKVARWLESIADQCLSPNCDRCVFVRELAKRVVNGELKKNVPLSAGKTFVPNVLPITPEFIAQCKAEGLADPVKALPNFISWCKEERITKRDWMEFFLMCLRKKKDKEVKPRYVPPPVQQPKKLTQEERQAAIEKLMK